MIDEDEALRDSVLDVARLMVAAAKTAPKARGVDNVVVRIVDRREELESLATKMEELSKIYGEFFSRDAQNVRNSVAVVLIGCKIATMNLKTPGGWKIDADTLCSIVNLGIALGSAVKLASMLNVDNRIMFTVGAAAQEMKLIDADYAFGVPLSATSKSIYFDRMWQTKR
ncbi:MAG: DUF2148 domain-containing protein [Ignisphaera sp.]|nr:DUF2148 domain-containing protein [Ignisphaera sp.]MDW8084790.1 DUF2148 domain-containing protein [Ignisphaera sp.]